MIDLTSVASCAMSVSRHPSHFHLCTAIHALRLLDLGQVSQTSVSSASCFFPFHTCPPYTKCCLGHPDVCIAPPMASHETLPNSSRITLSFLSQYLIASSLCIILYMVLEGCTIFFPLCHIDHGSYGTSQHQGCVLVMARQSFASASASTFIAFSGAIGPVPYGHPGVLLHA